MKLLRTFPPLDARLIIEHVMKIANEISSETYSELVAHPTTI